MGGKIHIAVSWLLVCRSKTLLNQVRTNPASSEIRLILRLLIARGYITTEIHYQWETNGLTAITAGKVSRWCRGWERPFNSKAHHEQRNGTLKSNYQKTNRPINCFVLIFSGLSYNEFLNIFKQYAISIIFTQKFIKGHKHPINTFDNHNVYKINCKYWSSCYMGYDYKNKRTSA